MVRQVNGTWGTAAEVRGTAALNAGGTAQVSSVSCRTAGNCSAGGTYADGSGHRQAFVVSQVSGKWGTAAEVPGTAALNKGGQAQIDSVSCGSAGDCSAGGSYSDSSGKQQAFVVRQVNGQWHAAAEVRGTAALNAARRSARHRSHLGAAARVQRPRAGHLDRPAPAAVRRTDHERLAVTGAVPVPPGGGAVARRSARHRADKRDPARVQRPQAGHLDRGPPRPSRDDRPGRDRRIARYRQRPAPRCGPDRKDDSDPASSHRNPPDCAG